MYIWLSTDRNPRILNCTDITVITYTRLKLTRIVLRKMSQYPERHGAESSAEPDMWINGLPQAEWDLAMFLYYPAYQHPPGINYREEVLPIVPI